MNYEQLLLEIRESTKDEIRIIDEQIKSLSERREFTINTWDLIATLAEIK